MGGREGELTILKAEKITIIIMMIMIIIILSKHFFFQLYRAAAAGVVPTVQTHSADTD